MSESLIDRTILSMDGGRLLDQARWYVHLGGDDEYLMGDIDSHRAQARCGTPYCLAGHIIAAANVTEILNAARLFGPGFVSPGSFACTLWGMQYGNESSARVRRKFLETELTYPEIVAFLRNEKKIVEVRAQ